jgi:trimethylamine--corrinoid protein Co-methyltransferase
MSTTQMVFCGPEQALMAVAMTQMGKHYGLPVYINVGLSDSKIPDAQAGMEVGITLMLGALAGADIFGHLGICGVDLGTSLTMLAMQHETISYVERVLRGFEIDADTLGLDIIDRVAPGVGNYLAEDHTFAHFRQELWNPLLLDRNYWEGWRARPDKDLAVRCRDYKNNLLREHVPAPMAEDLAREMDALVAAARQELVGASAGQVQEKMF